MHSPPELFINLREILRELFWYKVNSAVIEISACSIVGWGISPIKHEEEKELHEM